MDAVAVAPQPVVTSEIRLQDLTFPILKRRCEMRFSVHAPLGVITPNEFQTMDAVRAIASAFESAGIDACYLTDHPAPSAEWLHANGHDALDPFTALGFLAAASTTLQLMTFVVVIPYRNPFITAKAAATLQVLSGGRLIMGAGTGYQRAEFEALGVDPQERGVLFDEALEAIRLAWKGGAVVKKGRNFNAIGNEPRPVPSPTPPIWIGGSTLKAVRRAARWGDGWLPVFSAPNLSKVNQETFIQSEEELRDKIILLKELREEAGRTGPFEIGMATRRNPEIGRVDGAERYLEALGSLSDAGVTWGVVDLPHPDLATFLENVQWFGEEVIARLSRPS